MPFATTQVNLEGSKLTEISQAQKNIVWSHLHVKSTKVEFIKLESGMVVARHWEVRNGEMLVKEYILLWVSSGELMYSMVIIVNNTVLYTWNPLREQISSVFTIHTHYVKWVMDILVNLIVVIISQVYVYKIITLYTLKITLHNLNTYDFYLSIILQ